MAEYISLCDALCSPPLDSVATHDWCLRQNAKLHCHLVKEIRWKQCSEEISRFQSNAGGKGLNFGDRFHWVCSLMESGTKCSIRGCRCAKGLLEDQTGHMCSKHTRAFSWQQKKDTVQFACLCTFPWSIVPVSNKFLPVFSSSSSGATFPKKGQTVSLHYTGKKELI